MTDNTAFFNSVRASIFHEISEAQVAGCEAILAEAITRALSKPQTAYVLATAYWESDHTMQPVRELGEGRGHSYGVPDAQTGEIYYGRGLVQLTWKGNYAKFGKLIEVDLVGNPDLALDLPIAIKIIFAGMIGGLFTGRNLSNYFGPELTDYVNARRIINGTDKANIIAGIARHFEAALAA